MRRMRSPLAAAYLTILATLALAPIASLLFIIASQQAGDWGHPAAYVLPPALTNTATFAGVALGVVTPIAGAGTAWLVTTFEFPARTHFVWLSSLPLAIPDLHRRLRLFRPVRSLWAGGMTAVQSLGWQTPNIRPARSRRDLRACRFVLYLYVYLAALRADHPKRGHDRDGARVRRASRWQLTRDIALPLARPAIATGIDAGFAGNPE